MLRELLTPSFVGCVAVFLLVLGAAGGFRLGVAEGKRRALNRISVEAAAERAAKQKSEALVRLIAGVGRPPAYPA